MRNAANVDAFKLGLLNIKQSNFWINMQYIILNGLYLIIVTLPIHYVPFDVPFVVAVFEAEDSSVVCAVVTLDEPFNVFITTG